MTAKIAVIVQFYLDAVFPRDSSWSNWGGLNLQSDTLMANVRPWAPSFEELFPTDLDKSLAGSSLSLQSVSMPGGAIRKTVADTVVDRVQVDLRWVEDDSIQTLVFDFELALDRAVDAANVLMEHIRVAARAASVPRVRRAWRPQDGRYYLLTPSTMAVYDADSGEPLPVFAGVNGWNSPGALRAPETGFVSIQEIGRSFSAGADPLLHISLLLDAETAVESLALREAILAIASACEVAANSYIESKAGSNETALRRSLQGSFASKFYEQAPSQLSSRSLKHDDPSAFALIEEMYRERNSLIHRGRMTQRLLDMNSKERQRVTYAYLAAGYRASDWINGLA